MKTRNGIITALVVATLLGSGAAMAQTAPRPTGQARPETVEGQVVKIDRAKGLVTIRTADGTVHEFQAGAETLQDLKEGDRIEAKRRQ
jgi:hypothetical protein